MKGVLFCVLVIVTNVFGESRIDPLVLISSQGLVKGLKATDGDYSIFLGIPYAEVDPKDPFGPAKARSAFPEIIYYATNGSVQCPQMSSENSDTQSLDCLRLNIYVPFKASSYNPLPVLLWIHGGEFVRGRAGEYGVKNIVRHDVVVVTINYRLGPYGFMCLDIPAVPGNQGLKDQYAALSWIKKNIASFGGNPYNITIGGQDAGATSVLLQLYANKDTLFHKAIVESGTPQSEGMFVNADVNAAIKIAAHLGMNTTDTKAALMFLVNTPHSLVTAAAYDLNLQLRPCRERSFSGISNFVEDDPYSMISVKKVTKTPVLIGYTSQERDSLSGDYFNSDPFYKKIKNNFNLSGQQLETASKTVRRFYIGDKPISEEVTSELKDFESDFVYKHPSERMINKLLEDHASQIYKYVFNYGSGGEGAGHSSELNYLFTNSKISVKDAADQLITDRITTLWANFIKYGNPTPTTTDLIPVKWKPVTANTRPTMVIDTDIQLDSRVDHQRMAFWDLFYSMYGSYNILTRQCSFTTCC